LRSSGVRFKKRVNQERLLAATIVFRYSTYMHIYKEYRKKSPYKGKDKDERFLTSFRVLDSARRQLQAGIDAS
jgi:hypothetical protein